MFHCKMMAVDGRLASVGYTNFDNRSFRLNDEANLNVHEQTFADKMTGIFEADPGRSKEMTYEERRQRPWHERLMEKLASLFPSQL